LYANTGGKYYVSVLVETEHEELPQTGRNIGLDLGIKDLCITSDGKRHENPKIIRKHEKKLAKLQRQLGYKAKWNERKYIKIDTFYASSQLCSVCGYQNAEIKNLSVREWTCPACGAKHEMWHPLL
jgi:transposase